MKKPFYFFLQWDITSRCNLNCLHCYHTKEERNTRPQLSQKEGKALIDDLHQTTQRWGFQGSIHFSGGEPLTRPDIFDLIAYANQLNLRMRLLSNGTLITPETSKELKKLGFKIVQVSIDGTEQTHNYLRDSPTAFQRARQGIINLKQAGISPTVSSTLTKKNIEELEGIIKLSLEAGADRIGFSRLVPDGTGKQLETLTSEEIRQAFLTLKELKKKYKGRIEILRSDPLYCLITERTNVERLGQELDKITSGCAVGYKGISVLSDGTVYPCRRMQIPIGNIRDGLAKVFIESPLLDKLRDLSQYENCNTCENQTLCRGCRAVAYAHTGNPLGADPHCFK